MAESDDDLPRLVMYVRSGCHLCEPARDVVSAVAHEVGVRWVDVDVDAPPSWAGPSDVLVAAFGDKVPAVTVDAALVAYWRISPDVLRRALVARS